MNRSGTTSNSAARNKTNGEITLRWIISWCIRDLEGIWAYLFVTALNLLLLNIFIIYLSYCWDIDDAKTFSFHHLLKKNIRKLDLFTFWQCLIHKYNNNLYLLLKGIKAAQIQHNYYFSFPYCLIYFCYMFLKPGIFLRMEVAFQTGLFTCIFGLAYQKKPVKVEKMHKT